MFSFFLKRSENSQWFLQRFIDLLTDKKILGGNANKTFLLSNKREGMFPFGLKIKNS